MSTTYNQDGTYDVKAGLNAAVTVTKNGGTPSGQVPVVTLRITSLPGILRITSTNGAEAIVNGSIRYHHTAMLDYLASGGEIMIGTAGSLVAVQGADIGNDGTVDVGVNTFGRVVLGPTISVSYSSGGGTFIVHQKDVLPPGTDTGGIAINGFGASGDYIDDTAIKFGSIQSYTISYDIYADDEKIVFKDEARGHGNTLGSVTIDGDPFRSGRYGVGSGPLFLTNDGFGGTDIQGCLLAGTAIATPEAERPVETLAPGDLVLTASGASRPVVWVGHRTVERVSLREAEIHDPVVIAADAFAPGIPARDLRVTPDHAILVDDRLIPARLLVNGTTIRQVPVATYTYYHVELDAHDILLAEGLTVESYLDCADRGRFANADVVALHAAPAAGTDAAAVYAAHGYRPLTLDAATVRPVWQTLADRAAALGHADAATATTADAGLHLLVAGRRVAPVAADHGRYVFSLPPGAGEVTLVSRAARPSRVRPWLDDRRALGVKVRRVRHAADGIVTPIALDGPAPSQGWHGIEDTGRWTDGRATLILPRVDGPATLDLTFDALDAYPVEARVAGRAA